MHPLKLKIAPPSKSKLHPLTRFLSKLRLFAKKQSHRVVRLFFLPYFLLYGARYDKMVLNESEFAGPICAERSQKGMKERYDLNTDTLPNIPTPHDCIIKEIRLDKKALVFVFEDDISYHDSIKYIKPCAKSLTMTFRLADDIYDISLYIRGKPNRILHRAGAYREIDLIKHGDKLFNLPEKRTEYLWHYVGYRSLIVRLCSCADVVLAVTADYVELDWSV